MIRKLGLSVLFVAFACTVLVAAPPQATIILRNGDRISGLLADLGGYDYTMMINGQERRIPKGEVAMIDFAGGPIPATDIAKMKPGQHLIVLRSGDIFYGHIVDINGTEPRRITFDTQSGGREVVANDIARIYLERWEGMPQADAPAPAAQPTRRSSAPALQPGGAGMSIPARPCWTDTGLTVTRGQQVAFEGSGEIQLSSNADDIATVAGSKTGRRAPNAPLRGALAGALIGRVGNSQAFGIGNQTQAIAMPASGPLYLGVNDDDCNDNRGEFRVVVNARQLRRR